MLGAKLPRALVQTTDIDVAQFSSVSVAIGDQTPPMLELLRRIDKSFREISRTSLGDHATSYAAQGGLRVDFLTPNEGRDSDNPQPLPAFQTAAQQLRFLDFLIHEPVQAALLHGSGVLVRVPAPERYAIHKLILARRRSVGAAKADKDVLQAESLLNVLVETHADALKSVWEEAYGRGPTWRKLLLGGMVRLPQQARDQLLKALGRSRDLLPGVDLTFNNPPVRYNSTLDVVSIDGESLGETVACAISREALEDHFGADGMDAKSRVELVLKYRTRIEQLLRTKFLSRPVDETGSILLRSADIEVREKSL